MKELVVLSQLFFVNSVRAFVTADSIQEFHNLNYNQKLVLQTCVCQEFHNDDEGRTCSQYDESYSNSLFSRIDLNEDREIAFQELALWVGYFKYNTTNSDIHTSFLHADRNSDGLISLDELSNAQSKERFKEDSLRITKNNSSCTEEEYAAIEFGRKFIFPHLEELFCKEEKIKLIDTMKKDKEARIIYEKLDSLPTCKNSTYNITSKEAELFRNLDTDKNNVISAHEFNANILVEYLIEIMQMHSVAESLMNKMLTNKHMKSFLEILLQRQSSWSRSRTPLMYASSRGFVNVVDRMLTKEGNFVYNIDKHEVDDNRNSALTLAAWEGQVDTLDLLMKSDLSPNQKNSVNLTALQYAAIRNNKPVLDRLLSSSKTNVNIGQEKHEPTALIYASAAGYENIVSSLLKHNNIDVNAVNEYKQTSLIIAASWNRTEVVKLLLNHTDVDCNLVDNDYWTAMMYATFNDYSEVTQMFLENDRCDKTIRDRYEWTAFEVAFYNLRNSVITTIENYDSKKYSLYSWKAWVRKFSVSNYIVWLVAFNILVPLLVLLLIMYNSKTWQSQKETIELN